MTREACLDAAVDGVRLARRFTDDVEFSAEDATRSDRDFLCRVIDAVIREGCRTVNLPDTVGYATPDETRAFFTGDPRRASPTPTGRSSARTATTTSAWPSPTASPPSRAARARSSARSTASASAPATPRSRRS